MVNMYKDYKSGEGASIETIPGFRKIHDFGSLYGIHLCGNDIYAHTGDALKYIGRKTSKGQDIFIDEYSFVWTEDYNNDYKYNDQVYIPFSMIPVPTGLIGGVKVDGEWVEPDVHDPDPESGINSVFYVIESIPVDSRVSIEIRNVGVTLSRNKSISFSFNNRMYLLDGEHYVSIDKYGACRDITKTAYIPTTHQNVDLTTTDADERALWEYEQRNMLTPKYRMKFIPNGKLDEFTAFYGVDEAEEDASIFGEAPKKPNTFSVLLDGVELPWAIKLENSDENGDLYHIPTGYKNAVISMSAAGTVKLVKAPPVPAVTEDDTVVLVAKKTTKTISGITTSDADVGSIITNCTIAAIFDNRVFLSGNPEYPRHIFWCAINSETGYPDCAYFPIVNYELEGISDAPVKAMIPVADTLMVLKEENPLEGSVLFHSAQDTKDPLYPTVYPSVQGLAGKGALGPACNFLDDPVFISKYGLEAMGQLSVRYERAIEHRSGLIDSRLLLSDLSSADIAEWGGYLLILVEGRIFMADSRQAYSDGSTVSYEWYYLEEIGVYVGQYPEYLYAEFPGEYNHGYEDLTGGYPIVEATEVVDMYGNPDSLIGIVANPDNEKIIKLPSDEQLESGIGTEYADRPIYCVMENLYGPGGKPTREKVYYYVSPTGAMIGGIFDPAVMLKVIDDDLYFITRGGVLCKFNFDKREGVNGLIPAEWYNFNQRTIFSGFATKMDNCGIPHLTKSTIKHSMVIKTRTRAHSNCKIKVRTNRKAFSQVGRIINGTETFEDASFSDFTFNIDEKNLFSVQEKEKKWVEKQVFIYSDEFNKPFALSYIAYRYFIAGRYKE